MKISGFSIVRLTILIVAVFFVSGISAMGETQGVNFIEIIIDCSETMKRDVDGVSKIDTTKAAVIDFINSAPSNYRFAVRIMGGDDNATYYTSKLIAGMGLLSNASLVEEINKLKAGGERSLFHAMNECLYDFPERLGGNVLLLITDGVDDGGTSLSSLEFLFENSPDAPRVFVYGLDITDSMAEEFGLLTMAAGGRVENLDDPSMLSESLVNAFQEIGGNLNIYLYDMQGNSVTGDIVIYDVSGNPFRAVYNRTSLSTTISPGLYTVEGRYLGETLKSNTIDTSGGKPHNINFVFETSTGNLFVTLYDDLYQPLKGYLKITDSSLNVVYEGGPADEFLIKLPEGRYEVEGLSSGRSWVEYGVVITGGANRDIEISVPVLQSILEVEVSNLESYSVNANIRIYTNDGFLIAEAQYTSYFQTTLPPGFYRVQIESGGTRKEQTVRLLPADQVTLFFEVDVEMGFLLVELRTKSGYDAWGVVRIYDRQGLVSKHWSIETDEGPDWSFELPEGTYRVEAEVEGIIRSRDSIRVIADEETWIEFKFPDYVR